MSPLSVRPAARLRLVLAAASLAATALIAAGCAQSPTAPAPTGSGAPSASEQPSDGDVAAAWLDEGRSIAVVTQGSSTCVPVVKDATASGQTITVTLEDPQAKACTKDLVPRASFAQVPAGVDVTKEVEVKVAYGTVSGVTALTALAAAPTQAPDAMPKPVSSAGWYSDNGIALLTWGSSSCKPEIDKVEQKDGGATVGFKTIDRVCTMDLGPRVTVIPLDQPRSGSGDFTLTLTGDGLDGTVKVIG